MGHALGIDVGTTNAKVALVADDGHVVACASRPIPTVRDGDIAEQSPDALWAAVVGAVRAVTSAAPDAAATVGAVLCASQYSSTVPVDAQGNPTGKLVLYLDQRGTDHSFAIMERHPESLEVFVDHHGIPTVGGGLSLAHLLYYQLDRPDVHAATAAYLEPMDFVNLRLTGRVAATQCTMLTTQMCDNRTIGVTEYDPELVRLAGVDADRLPPLIEIGAAVGAPLPEVAAELGIPADAVVYAGVNDSQVGAIATGAYRPGRAGAMIGTTSVLIETMNRKDTDLDHEIASIPGPLGDQYVVFAENGLGGKALEHLLTNLVFASDALGDHAVADHFEHLDDALRSVGAGSDGVLFLPWLAGTLAPRADTSMRGGFLNLSLDAGRTHLVRAVVEGICHNFAWLAPFVETFTGEHIDEFVFGGGAARSPVWAQTLADVVDRPVRTLEAPDFAGARAAALLAHHRAGTLDEADLAGLVVIDAEFEPNAANRNVHDSNHEQFVAAFDALQPIYRGLNG
ncbi:MAG: FGGY family carbohydrate kinase [Acidimicrobiia bacterium]|nr:FGGY family carbohydrate kinase [Acidimicrobiia bacterium]